jgi:hypothetical protein
LRYFTPERAFGEFRRHAQQTGEDHPERRARPADADGNRDTGDVAKPHSARQRRRQRLESG